jgi:hypothetical protein
MMTYPLLTRRRVLAAKVEATCGTAETLTSAEGVFNVFDAAMQPQIETMERRGQAVFGRIPGVPAAYGGQCTFAVELHGSGTPATPKPNWASTFLPGCGLIDSGGTKVFKPSSVSPTGGTTDAAVRTVTIGLYEDGLFKVIKGAMGNAVMIFTAGQVVRIEFTFTGVWVPPTDVGMLAPTYPTVKPLRFASSAIAIGAWNPTLQELRMDLGNDVQLREDSSKTEGYVTAVVVDRRINGTLNPESKLVAGNDLYGNWLAGAEAALAMSLGAGSDGNTVAFSGPKCQYTGVQEGERNGLLIDEVTYQLNRSAAAGDDELAITFS